MVHPKTDESDINQALQHYFEFPHFRPGQQQALEHVLSGSDTLVVMPTGHGKSLIYQLAALLMDGTALVISPLVSLMKDQVDSLIRRDIPATFVNSSLSTGEQARRLRDIASGVYKIVLVAPERLRSLPFRKSLSGTRLSMLVVDESHCLSQWGHDFRPDYLHIADARQDFSAPVTLALTATATRQVQDDIQKLLGLPSMMRVITGFNRPNLALDVVYTPDVHSKYKSLLSFLGDAEGAGIIYTGTRRDAEEVTEFIQEVVKIPARYYHAGLDAEARTEVQDAFMSGDLPHVVATNAFGMGIDRPDVRFVLHYTMPGTLEAYYQEAGRAGRDGLNSRAILLYSPQDTALHEYFIENDSPTLKELRQVHEYLHHVENLINKESGKGGIFTIRLDVLEAETYLNHVKARVSLEQLEKAQALIRYPTRATSMIQVQLRPLFESNLGDIAAQVQSRRRHKYAMLKKMVHYSETNECRRRVILSHFGDTSSADSPRCCDNCLAAAETDWVTHKPAQNEGELAALTILDTIAGIHPRLGKDKIARILSGSKAKNIARFTNFRHYAKLSSLYRREIVAMIDQLLSNGYVKSIGSRLPVLQLTPLGETTLKSRAAVEIDVSQIQRSQRQRRVTHAAAGETVRITRQLLNNGLPPEQIAAENGLTTRTIYSHLARLIEQGEVNINAVVPEEVQQKISAVIQDIGSTEYLSPIKARLPEDIDYTIIRCVVADWERKQTPEKQESVSKGHPKNCTQHIHAWGESGSQEHISELIGYLEDPNGNVRRLTASALGKLGSAEAVEPLLSLLKKETKPQVRQYTIKALGKIGDNRACTILEQIASDLTEKDYNRKAAKSALRKLETRIPESQILSAPLDNQDTTKQEELTSRSSADVIDHFLTQPHPRSLSGPWLAGWALDFHSRFVGKEQIRSSTGSLVFRYKYDGEFHLAGELSRKWLDLLADHPELPHADVVIPIPPSTPRERDPVIHLAQKLADHLKIPALVKALVKTRATRPQKEMKSLAAKKANIAGSFTLRENVKGLNLLLVDDLYDSGATLSEAAHTISHSRPASIVVLTLTKTIHTDK